MSSLIGILEDKFADKLRGVMGDWGAMPLFVPTKEEKFGDYQCNVALSCAKKQGVKPRELAEKAAEILRTEGGDCFAEVGIAGPGFINLRLLDGFLRSVLPSSCDGAQDGAAYCGQPGTVLGFVPNDVKVVVDYSSPNIAKQMHVGHLRSSIIGDSICRVLDFLGYQVVRQNHVGDWGTQFGLLCAWLMDHTEESLRGDVDLSDLEALYRQAQALANEDPVFHEQSRQRVVALHQGDAETIATWRYIVRKSLGHIENTYALLGVLLRNEDMRGESFYNPMLGALVEELQRKYPAGSRPLEVTVSQGATCIFMYDEAGQPLFKGTDDEPQPMIIRKADGAFLYPTTDLAALRFRLNELRAQRVIYTTDIRQTLHFKMLFRAAEMLGWLNEGQKLEHVTFGTVLGPDNKPLKTRSGENVKLADLLHEAVERAKAVLKTEDENGQPRFGAEEIENISRAVGIGSVKYADLSQNRVSDYVFSFDRMLAMDGNTAPYLLYAYARISSILRKAPDEAWKQAAVAMSEPAERRLALHLARFADTVKDSAEGWRLNLLCDYAYNLAGLYMKFYENCSVLSAPEAELRDRRLQLCDLTGRVLKTVLSLLGLNVVERM